ncbi:MAG TPA: DMT family transporter [Acidisarcina sp.]
MAGCLWGMGFYFGKIALGEMGVAHMVLYRFLFASITLLPLGLRHRLTMRAAELRLLLLASFLGVPVQFLVQFYGLKRTTVSHASLMVGTMPVILAVGASIFNRERAHERLDRTGWLAILGSSAGVALIVLGGRHAADAGASGPSLYGDMLVVLSLLIALFWILLNQRLMAGHAPVVVTTYGLLAGTAMLAVWVPLVYGMPPIHMSLRTWLALGASGALCTASSTLLWNWGIHRVPSSRAGVFLNIEPALGSILGVKLLGDHLGPFAWLGGGLIVAAAVALTTRGQQVAEVVTQAEARLT